MTVLIVEDEELAVEKLEHMVAEIEKEAELVGSVSSIKGTVEWLNKNDAPDIILLDIELSDGQSFEIFKQAEVESTVIFTTSYDEYAIKAFKVNSIDYLLKPVQKEDLKAAFDKYKKLNTINKPLGKETLNIQSLLKELQGQFQPKEYRRRFLVKIGQKHLPVEVDEINYFYIDERSTLFKTSDNRKLVIDYTLDEIESMLDEHRFFRINRSFIVSIESVRQMNDFFNSRLILKLHPEINKEVIVSREKVNDIKKWMGNKNSLLLAFHQINIITAKQPYSAFSETVHKHPLTLLLRSIILS
jgi:DNA-binding LytR/AlgR family response regulator